MRCPRCDQESLNPYSACAKCQFSGPPHQVEELGHVAYLLGELESWPKVGPNTRKWLRQRYLKRREELEIVLGLRPPPLTAEATRELQWELVCLDAFLREIDHWSEAGWIRPEKAVRLRQGARKRLAVQRERLEGAPPAPAFDRVQDRLNLLAYLEGMTRLAGQRDHFVAGAAGEAALADLQARREDLEVEAGLRLRPEPVPVGEPEARVADAAPPPELPRPPREPLTWDRIWQTLLSERTLNVLLFLGAFLMVASAITYVVYNWENLPPAAQLAAIVLFTLSFYGAGWFLRVRMGLRASGIAVTAVGSLLVPLDFYAVFVAGGALPEEMWPWVWLAASALCLPIYALTALRIRAGFFGYLVAAAAGSLTCAILHLLHVPSEWCLAALVALALIAAALAYRLKGSERTWSILANPLRFSALVATSVILPLGIGWWVASGAGGSQFDTSLAAAWTLGAILYTYVALREGSPWLGRAAATVLPVSLFLLLRLAFEPLGVELPWYALGWAGLALAYLLAGHRFHARASLAGAGASPVLRAHRHTATGWAFMLMVVAAVWSIFDLWAAAATYALLVAGVALAVRLWEQPRALPLASLLALLSITFGMAAAHLEPAELCLGWALLALLHVLVALRLQASAARAGGYTAYLFGASLACAAAALLPPLILDHEPLLTYTLGNWIVLAAWLAYLDRRGEQAGLTALLSRSGPLRRSALHWAVALPLPFFVALIYTRFRPADAWLGLLLVGLAWILFVIGQSRLLTGPSAYLRHWSTPWYVTGYACSLAGPLLALRFSDQPLLATTVLLASGLYFASAWAFRFRWWLVPAGLALPLGLLLLMDHWALPLSRQSLGLALVAALYLLGGVGLERRRAVARRFLAPLYAVAHLVAVLTLAWGLAPAVGYLFNDQPWPDPARLWAAGGQLVLCLIYGLFAWFQEQERWAHAAAWLGVMAGGLVASTLSQGRGSSAFQAALLASAYVLVERALAGGVLWRRWPRVGPLAAQAWPIYRRALLFAGWAVSAGAVALALVRNLVLLGGGRVQTAWAIAGLLAVTALYALSARLFRRRIFVWLAAVLIVAPWTLLTVWGWFLWEAPPLPQFALSWAALACLELGLGLVLTHSVVPGGVDYGFPLRVIANLLLPFALFWAVADPATSSLTWGLGLGFYVISAVADHRRGLTGWRGTRFLYPAVAVLPVWAVYLLTRFLPAAPYESYGLMLLAFALPLLAAGRRLARIDAADGVPLYLGAYGVSIVGTLLVAHQRPLFAAALTFDALLCALSARLFREPLWGYPAAALAPAAMLVALAESQVPVDRRGWWLIGLGAALLAIAWILRRARQPEFATPPLVMAFVSVALGLPPSSLDRVGAFWGYLAAALAYALAAAWLRQPLLLVASAVLSAVPYGVALVWLGVNPANYGLALFPAVAVALTLAHLLDWRLGRPVPTSASGTPPGPAWLRAVAPTLTSWLDWWAAPWYAWGYAGALVAVGLSLPLRSGQTNDPARLALALALASLIFLHATARFRSRGFLLLAGVLAQGAVLAVIDRYGWLAQPAWAALAFLPVTVATAALALAVELRRREGSPLSAQWWKGWSRPLYLLLAADLLFGQAAALLNSQPGAVVSMVHALLLALLATAWAQPALSFVATGVGVVALFQVMAWANLEVVRYPVGLALWALGYGLLGYGLTLALGKRRRAQIWSRPLEWTALGLSGLALGWAIVAGLDVADLLVRTLLGRPVLFADYAVRVQVLMWVLALSGLLYLATAAVRRWYVLGYGAVALLLVSWALWWRFFLNMAGIQWYAVPAGLYLLGVGWMEWRQGRRTLAGWIDRAGMLVWLGTSWWQSLPGVMDKGWPYALLMGAESLLLVWWGSARRQKQFLYVGAVALVLNVVTQSIEPLLSVNRWIVFGLAGLLLVSLAVLVERRLEQIREISADLQMRLEGWE